MNLIKTLQTCFLIKFTIKVFKIKHFKKDRVCVFCLEFLLREHANYVNNWEVDIKCPSTPLSF